MDTRPTSDKVREAIFDILADEFAGEPVLDLFAGTGALGIEALSRGASEAIFVERRRQACQVIKANLRHTGLESQARLLCMSVERALDDLDLPCGLVLLDPPYAYANMHPIMEAVGEARVVVEQTMVVLEHSPRFEPAHKYGCLDVRRQRVYGDTAVSIYIAQEEQNR